MAPLAGHVPAALEMCPPCRGLGPVVTFPSSPGGRPRGVRCVLSVCRAWTLVLDVLGSAPGAARGRAWRREADGNVTTGPRAGEVDGVDADAHAGHHPARSRRCWCGSAFT